ncbi:MAG: NUDIX hydrolase [Candidatus Anstonellales archaeon]
MGYIRDLLNNYDGKVICIGVGVIVINENDEVLLVKRKDNNLWDIPGGSVELYESLDMCASRELKEEVGISVNPFELEFNGITFDPITVNKEGKDIEIFSVSFSVRVNEVDIKLNESELVDYNWIRKSDVIDLYGDKLTKYSLYALSLLNKRDRKGESICYVF